MVALRYAEYAVKQLKCQPAFGLLLAALQRGLLPKTTRMKCSYDKCTFEGADYKAVSKHFDSKHLVPDSGIFPSCVCGLMYVDWASYQKHVSKCKEYKRFI